MMCSRSLSRAALLGLYAGLACSAGATQYADQEREGVTAEPAVPELGTAVTPGGGSAGNAEMVASEGPVPIAPATTPPGGGDAPSNPAPLPVGTEVPPSASAAGADAVPDVMVSGEVPSSATCALSVSVTTVSPGGRYTPRNVGAIWVADGEGIFIKSLNVWGDRRLRHVEAWNAATQAAGAAANVVDAVTGATERAHGVREGTWNCRDFGGQPVPDGRYRVYFEVTESNGAGPSTFANFTKGPDAETTQTAAPSFDDIILTFTP